MTSPDDSHTNSNEDSPEDSNEPGSVPAAPRSSRGVNRLFKVAVIGLGTVATVYGTTWWQDRPLREIDGMLVKKQPQLALAKANLYLSSSPENVRLKALKARALIDLGKAGEGVAIFEEIGLETTPEMYAMARGYMKLAVWTRAASLLKEVMVREPRNAEALQDLIGCEFQTGMYKDGLADAEALTKLPDGAARGWSWRAFFFSSVDDHEQAITAFAKTLEVAPDVKDLPVSAEEFLLRYGQALAAAGKAKEARDMFERSLAVAPSAPAFAELAKLQQAAGDEEGALKTFAKAVEFDPAQPDACEALAAKAIADGDFELAQRRLAPLAGGGLHRLKTAELLLAIFEKKSDAGEIRRWKGRIKQMKAREEIDVAIKQLMRKAPESFWAMVVRAHDFAASGNWNQAEALLQPFQEQGAKEDFVLDLYMAIKERGPLPSLERLPLDKF